MNKNLIRVIVYGAYFLIAVGLIQLVDHIIPIQPHEFFTATGMVRFVIFFLIVFLGSHAVQLILRKYGAWVTPTSPRAKTILWVVIIFLFFMLLFGPYLFFNGRLPFSVFFR
ncbi:MAG: hypothetical protein ABSE68_01885 [Minisyncoccia bacterium]